MSDLLPNLDALLRHLDGEGAGRRDARALADAVASATTLGEVDEQLRAVVEAWRES